MDKNNKDNHSQLNENDRLKSYDFDFDSEYQKSEEEKKTVQNKLTVPNINVTVQSNDELDGLSPVRNPSFFFDFRQLLKPFNFKFITSNQHVFLDDTELFSCIQRKFIFNDIDGDVWIPSDNNIHQPDILRIYIRRKSDKLLIPVIVTENTRFNNLSEYNISNDSANELCCYLSYHYQTLVDIRDRIKKPDLFILYNLIPFNMIFLKGTINEHQIYDKNETGCSRCIWVDYNRQVAHGPRIKFQHNKKYTSTKKWATLTVDGKFLHDQDSTLSSEDRELLVNFVKYNRELISDIFYGKKHESCFLSECVKLDDNGNPIYNKRDLLNDESLSIGQKIKDNMFICTRKQDWLKNVIYNNNFLFDEWFNDIFTDKDSFVMKYDNYSKTKYFKIP